MANEIALQEGLGIPSLPVVPTTLPITITRPRTQEQVEAARQELIPRQELATSARSDIRTIQEAWQAEKRKIERKALGEREIDLLKLEKERPIPKELPTFESPKKTFDELFSVLMVGAMTASGAGKSNFMAAANSMIGAMEGYQKGKKNEFDQAVKEFDISLKKALQEEKINNAKYQQIWASRKLTIQEKFNQTMLQADAAQDKITAAIARLGDVEKLERRIADKEKELKSIDDARIKAEERINEIKQRSADRDARIAAARLTGRTAQTWEVTDEQGKKRKISVMPQYDTQGRQTNEPAGGVLLGTGARAGTTTGGGSANDRYAFNINESFSQAAQDLLNVSQMPSNTVLGAFAGMTGRSGDSLATALRNNLARTVTSADAKMMQQIVAGLDQNMARALGGGYASSTSKGLIEAYKEQVAQYGDSPFAQATFLSRMKQELGILAKAFKNHPGSNEGYVRDMKEYMDSLNEAIPFNVSDVISTVRGQRPTVTQKFSRVIQTPSRLSLPALGSRVTADEGTGAEQAPATAAPSGPAASRAPEGVPQEVWNAMTPQERALWPR